MGARLGQLMERAREQRSQVEALAGELSAEQFGWQPDAERWSIAQHLAHLALTNDAYLERLDDAIDSARDRGLMSPGPYRRPILARLFLLGVGPPVRFRIKTFGRLTPPPDPSGAHAVREFVRAQEHLIDSMRRADGVDLGRATIRSPFLNTLRMSAFQGFQAVILHNDRHFWLADRVREDARFPAS